MSLNSDNKYLRELLCGCENCLMYLDRQFDEVNTELENHWNFLTEANQESLIIQAIRL